MLKSTAAPSVLEFNQTLSFSQDLLGTHTRYIKISLKLPRSPDITMDNGIQSQTHPHTHIHTCMQQEDNTQSII